MTTSPQAAGPPAPNAPELASARVERRFGISWIWAIPLAALALCGYLLFEFAAGRGPGLTISFKTADGLLEDRTEVRYKAVRLGVVEDIGLSPDLSHVNVRVRFNHQAEAVLTPKARFWVVRARLGRGLKGFQSGLETLVSGAYIAVDPGPARASGKLPERFVGLEQPPEVRSNEPGTAYVLDADELGGIGQGAPVYYRELKVGEVLSSELDGARVKSRVFVRAPYDSRVVEGTCFWNTSGLGVSMGPGGIELKLASLQSLLDGGVAFDTPAWAESRAPSPAQSAFPLYASHALAEVHLYRESIPYVTYVQGSTSGLLPGSQVRLFGKQVGAVTDVSLVPDPRAGHASQLAARVAFVLQPGRLDGESARRDLAPEGMQQLLDANMRVALESGNLLTGEQLLHLEYVPGTTDAAATRREGNTIVLPGDTRDLGQIGSALSSIAARLDRIPFERIGNNLDQTLASLRNNLAGPELGHAISELAATLAEVRALSRQARKDLAPALARLPAIAEKLDRTMTQAQHLLGEGGYGPSSSAQHELERTMRQLAAAARSIRLLADFLTRHPEAVLRGRKAGDL